MFEIGFSELVLVAIVALLVVGPERLPELVRTVGHWVGRFRRMADEVNAEVQRELHNAEVLRRETEKLQQQLNQDTLEKLASPPTDIPPGDRKDKTSEPRADTPASDRKDKTSDPS